MRTAVKRPCLDDREVLAYVERWHSGGVECLDDRAVQAWLGGGLLDPEADAVRSHLDTCISCSELIAAVVETHWVGQRLGRYRIVEPLGVGAMGEVYRAEDPDLGRDVAIKLVRPGGSQRRLLREAQAMAQLAHPHVIRVYDVGTIGDDVFLAMELVQGKTLRAWFAEARGWRAIASTLRQAGAGLAAAHAAKLVHGDFKPDNVLVADDGRVLVTDFGLARAHLDDEVTPPAAPAVAATNLGLAGTPAYMAPEHFEDLIATPASDQYSFCVSLYEGLYRKRPFDGPDLPALRAALAAGKLELPSGPPARIVRALRRGLSADPAARFPSMQALLAELEASSRTHVAWVAGAAAVVAAAVGTSAYYTMRESPVCTDGTSQLDGVWDDATRTRVHEAFDASKLPYAATSFATVSALLDEYRARWIATYTDTCRATHVRKDQSEALLDARMTCLHHRRDELRALVRELTAANVNTAVGAAGALRPISDCEDVASLQETERLPADPAVRTRIATVDAELARCEAIYRTGNHEPARACATAATATAHELGYEPTIAQAELLAAQVATRLEHWPEVDAALKRALLAAEAGRDPRARARALIWMVSVAARRTTFSEGHERSEHASAIVKGLGNEGGLAAELAYHRGTLLLREGKLDDAEQALRHALALREQLYGSRDARVAEPLGMLAVVQITRKQLADARTHLERAISIQEAAFGPTHPNVGKSLHALAQLEARAGKHDAALAAQQRSYDILLAAYGERHRDVAQSVGLAAQVRLFAGKYEEAVPFAKRAVELMEQAAGPDSTDTAVALQSLAATYSRAGKNADALAIHRRVLDIQLRVLGPEHLQTTQAQVNLAMALRFDDGCAEALVLLDDARAARIKTLGAQHPDVARVLHTQGDCLVDLNRAKEAVAPLEKVLATYEQRGAKNVDDRVALAQARYSLARALWDAGGDRARAHTLAKASYAELTALKDKRAESPKLWATKRKLKLD